MPARRNLNAYTVHNKVEIVRGGADYFEAIEDIADKARYSIHLQTYIFDEDETGTKIADALIRAARRNVFVYLLVDGYASQNLSPQFITRMKDAGVHFSFFDPLLKSRYFYFGRRLHHKVVVADSNICLVAGVNVSNRYNDIGKITAWLDWAIYDEGEVARQLNAVCTKIWDRSVFRKKCLATAIPSLPQLPAEECMVRIRRNDWTFRKTQITNTYRQIFRTAGSEVVLMTSYFWPPRKLLRDMAKASARGVKIKLVLTAKADVPLAKYVERYLYSWLFRHNMEIYEYQRNILHGKIAVCDKEWLTAGSYNVNNISAFASVELNLDVKNTVIATQVTDKLHSIITNDCEQITSENFAAKHNYKDKVFYYLSYRLIHLIFFLFTFYFIQRREKD